MAQEGARTVLELLLEAENDDPYSTEVSRGRIDGLVIGQITSLDENGRPQVVFAGQLAEVLARTTVPIRKEDIHRNVCIMFDSGNPKEPIVIGVLQPRRNEAPHPDIGHEAMEYPIEARIDGERIVLEGKKEIVLKCGKASITLTHAGKVLIRGAYIGSSSSGVNRIKGGSVQIN